MGYGYSKRNFNFTLIIKARPVKLLEQEKQKQHIMKKLILTLALALVQFGLWAQAPNISYPSGTKNYTTGTTISPLTPSNSGGTVPTSVYAQVTTFAGDGTSGTTGEIVASLSGPRDIAKDASGNFFIVDTWNNRIQKITPSGVVSTFAGSGTAASVDGTGVEASFNMPNGLVFDTSGNMFVCDNSSIRKITPSGVVTTFAGSDTTGAADGTGSQATFEHPNAIAIDSNGNLFVAENFSNKIRKITPSGVVTTFAQNTSGINNFSLPLGIAVDVNNNIYVANGQVGGAGAVLKITPAGVVSTFVNNTVIESARGITIDSTGTFFVSNRSEYAVSGQESIYKISSSGVVSFLAGGYWPSDGNPPLHSDGIGSNAYFYNANLARMTTDGAGNLYVTEIYGARVRKISYYGYSINPELSLGLSFNGTTGTISGTPIIGAATTAYAIDAYNQSGKSSTAVSINVTSINANLSALHVFSGTLSPSFALATTSYTTNIASATTKVTPTTEDPAATVQVRINGGTYTTVAYGATSGNLSLNVGTNVINVKVTSPNLGVTKTYTVTVTRAAASNLYTVIPDENFEQALIDLGYDTTIDGRVLTSNISGLTSLDVSSKNIADLTGIQAFTSLTDLSCGYNSLTSLNVSNLSSLYTLGCSGNQLTSINVNGLTSLYYLYCDSNQLTSLNVSGLTSLYDLHCDSNQLTSINVSGLTNLQNLQCGSNQLTSLNVNGLTNLGSLNCDSNQLTSLSITGLTSLYSLGCSSNLLTSLNLVGLTNLQGLYCDSNSLSNLNFSELTNLVNLNCGNNQFTSLNLSSLTGLTTLDCYNNQLVSLNISGLQYLTHLACQGNLLTSLNVSGSVYLGELTCSENHLTDLNLSHQINLNSLTCNFNNIYCIIVADPVAAAANTAWIKDATASYSTNCGVSNIPTSKVKANQCGSTLSSLSANINADYYAGYQQYRFEVTNGATINTVDVNKYNFSLTQTPGITYGTTYGIRVAIKMGGAWGAYGVSCNVTTPVLTVNLIPTTTIMPSFCGTTLAALDTKIGATLVSAASGYRFEITTGGVTTIYDSTVYNFRLAQAGVAAYGSTYTIRVAALVNGVYSNYGASCNITTPVLSSNTVPTTQIHPNFCGTTLTALDTKIPASPVSGATGYRFEITTGGVTTVYDSTTYNFKLSQAGVVVANGTTYTIRVAALVNGVYGNFGVSCNVYTLGATAREYITSTEFAVAAYPNPFNSAFKLQVTASTDETIFVSVYDMMGKQVEHREVKASEIENATIGQDYATGIYNVLVSQGVNTKTVRLVKN